MSPLSQITEIHCDTDDFNKMKHNFEPIKNLQYQLSGSFIDIMGIIIDIRQNKGIIELDIMDITGKVTVRVFQNTGDNHGYVVESVIIFHGCKVIKHPGMCICFNNISLISVV